MPEIRRELSVVAEGDSVFRLARTVKDQGEDEIVVTVDGFGERRLSLTSAERLGQYLISAAKGV